jgi:hypothetical protein
VAIVGPLQFAILQFKVKEFRVIAIIALQFSPLQFAVLLGALKPWGLLNRRVFKITGALKS